MAPRSRARAGRPSTIDPSGQPRPFRSDAASGGPGQGGRNGTRAAAGPPPISGGPPHRPDHRSQSPTRSSWRRGRNRPRPAQAPSRLHDHARNLREWARFRGNPCRNARHPATSPTGLRGRTIARPEDDSPRFRTCGFQRPWEDNESPRPVQERTIRTLWDAAFFQHFRGGVWCRQPTAHRPARAMGAIGLGSILTRRAGAGGREAGNRSRARAAR